MVKWNKFEVFQFWKTSLSGTIFSEKAKYLRIFFWKSQIFEDFFLKNANVCACSSVIRWDAAYFFLLWCCSVKTVKTVSVNVTYQTVILSKIVYHNLATSEISENRKWKPSLNETFSCDEAFSLKEVRLYSKCLCELWKCRLKTPTT